MISKKKVHLSVFFALFAFLFIFQPVFGAVSDFLTADDLYTNPPFWYPCHDWKFSWFVSCTYTPVINLTLGFAQSGLGQYSLSPIIGSPRSLPLNREVLLFLPDILTVRIDSNGESFTPVIYPSVTFMPSSGSGGSGGLLGTPGSSGGTPPDGPDLSVDLPPIVFDPVVDPPIGPVDLVLPIPDPVLPVPVPPDLTVPPGASPRGSDEPIPSPGVTPPSSVPAPTPLAPRPAPIPTPAPFVPTPTPTSPPVSGYVPPSLGGIIDGIGDFFGDIFGGGADWDFGDAPDGTVAYPDTAE